MKKKTQEILLKRISASAEKQVGSIDAKIDRMLESAILSLVGLERNGRGVEIDHCNGRNSVLIDAFRNLVVKKAEKMAKELKLDNGKMDIYRAAFDREYSSQINRYIKTAADKKAQKDAQEFIDQISVSVEDYLDLTKL